MIYFSKLRYYVDGTIINVGLKSIKTFSLYMKDTDELYKEKIT